MGLTGISSHHPCCAGGREETAPEPSHICVSSPECREVAAGAMLGPTPQVHLLQHHVTLSPGVLPPRYKMTTNWKRNPGEGSAVAAGKGLPEGQGPEHPSRDAVRRGGVFFLLPLLPQLFPSQFKQTRSHHLLPTLLMEIRMEIAGPFPFSFQVP